MKTVICIFLILILNVGCSRINNTSSVSESPISGDDDTIDNEDGDSITTSGPVNLDSNIESMQIGDTTYSVIYTEAYFYSEEETGFNPNIYVDTFDEDPQFTADETIILSEGQTEVTFSDSAGDWPPIQVEFY